MCKEVVLSFGIISALVEDWGKVKKPQTG